jgi:hypothetical protein
VTQYLSEIGDVVDVLEASEIANGAKQKPRTMPGL